jgi:hypothetical protein
MVKNKADCSPEGVGDLPKSAHDWMRQFRAATPKQPHSSLADDLFPSTANKSSLPHAADDVQTFRDWHYLTQPNTSVAGLDIDNDLFLLIIQEDIFTVAQLEDCLHADRLSEGEKTHKALDNIRIQKKLRRAIDAWYKDQHSLPHSLQDY